MSAIMPFCDPIQADIYVADPVAHVSDLMESSTTYSDILVCIIPLNRLTLHLVPLRLLFYARFCGY